MSKSLNSNTGSLIFLVFFHQLVINFIKGKLDMGNLCASSRKNVDGQYDTKEKMPSQYNLKSVANREQQLYLENGKLEEKVGGYDKAIQQYQLAIQANPYSSLAYNGIGNCKLRLGQILQARDNFNKAIQLDSQCKFAYNGLGVTYQIQNQYGRARENFQKAIDIDRDFYFPYNSMGNILCFQKQFSEAQKYYKRADQICPGNPLVQVNMAYCLLMMEQYDRSYEYLVSAKRNTKRKETDLTPQNKSYIYQKLQDLKINVDKVDNERKQKFIDILSRQMEKKSSMSQIKSSHKIETQIAVADMFRDDKDKQQGAQAVEHI